MCGYTSTLFAFTAWCFLKRKINCTNTFCSTSLYRKSLKTYEIIFLWSFQSESLYNVSEMWATRAILLILIMDQKWMNNWIPPLEVWCIGVSFSLQCCRKMATSRCESAMLELPERHYCYLGYGYIAARTDTTQQSGQTPDKEVEIKNITVYVSGYSETDTTGMLSRPTAWRFSAAADINSMISTFLSGVCPDCCVVSVLASL